MLSKDWYIRVSICFVVLCRPTAAFLPTGMSLVRDQMGILRMARDNTDGPPIKKILEWFRKVTRSEKKGNSGGDYLLDKETEMSPLSLNSTVNTLDSRKIPDPMGDRWAEASPSTDISGKWKPIVTKEFVEQYDAYLKNCSQSAIFRNIVKNAVGLARENLLQEGTRLQIVGSNPVGAWNRTLVSSGGSSTVNDFNPVYTAIVDPDSETVEVEAWWTHQGTRHHSILRGKPRVKGGEFITIRYLDPEDSDTMLCDSYFQPGDNSGEQFRPGYVQWRYTRQKE